MANGDNNGNGNGGRITWDTIAKISQVAILPLLAAMFFLLMQISSLDRRLAVIEVTTSRPAVDAALIRELTLLGDRQNTTIRRVDSIEKELTQHREMSTYDPQGRTRSIPRER